MPCELLDFSPHGANTLSHIFCWLVRMRNHFYIIYRKLFFRYFNGLYCAVQIALCFFEMLFTFTIITA